MNANSNAQRATKKRDVRASAPSSHHLDPTTGLHQNAHLAGTNISNHTQLSQQQQQQHHQPRSRRRLSYPTTLPCPSTSVVSRIQPLAVIASVPNVTNTASTTTISGHQPIAPSLKMNDRNGTIEPPQTTAPNPKSTHHSHPIATSNHRQSSKNLTGANMPPQDHHHHEVHSSSSDSTAPASGTTAAPKNPFTHQKEEESQLYNFIVSLSESCRKHNDSAHGPDHENLVEEDPSRTAFCIPLTKAPMYCQDAIQTLQRILPHIETTLRNETKRIFDTLTSIATTTNPVSRTESQQRELHSLRVMTLHMCDFYNDILQHNGNSGFCPQAPHLLLHPQQSTFFTVCAVPAELMKF